MFTCISKRHLKNLFLCLIIITLFFGCKTRNLTSSSRVKADHATGEKCLSIVHTNDHHGSFWSNSKGEGGLLAQSTVISEIKSDAASKGCQVLLLSGGDINMGPFESNFSLAEPDFLAMKQLGFSAMAVGNHEFDVELSDILKQQTWVDFPFLSANVVYKSNNQPVFKPYFIKDLDGLKIGILGVTTTDAPRAGAKFPVNDVAVTDPNEAARPIVADLRESSDIVIALAHLGYYKDKNETVLIKGSVSLASNVPGIDVIIDGHSHTKLASPDTSHGSVIVQAGSDSKYVGRLDLQYSNGQISVQNYQLIPINVLDKNGNLVANMIQPNDHLKPILQPFKDKVATINNEIIGQSLGRFEGERDVIRAKETNLGNLTTAIIKKATNADLVVIVSGFIRTSLDQGNISYGQILTINPFKLKLATVELTGQELQEYLNVAVNMTPGGDGGYPQMAGVKVRLENGIAKDIMIAAPDGSFQPLDASKTYKLGFNTYMAQGVVNYPILVDHPTYKILPVVDAEVIRDFIKNNSPINPNDYPVTGYFTRQ